jgi:hypothetical protein
VSGLALNDAVGAAAGGGGGGGGGTLVLWQALSNIIALNANVSEIPFKFSCFTFSSQNE